MIIKQSSTSEYLSGILSLQNSIVADGLWEETGTAAWKIDVALILARYNRGGEVEDKSCSSPTTARFTVQL